MPEPYTEHLWDELRRIDALVRARAGVWERTVGRLREAPAGLPHVSEDEVREYLESPVGPHDDALEEGVPEAERQRALIDERLAEGDGETPLERLVQRFGLSDLERDVLLVCLLSELDERYRRLYGFLMDDASRSAPSARLIVEVLRPLADSQAQVRATLDPDGALRAHRLVVIGGDERAPYGLSARAVRVDDRIVAHLLGSQAPDGRLADALATDTDETELDDLIVEADQRERLARLAAWAGERTATVLLCGPRGSGRTTVARALCRRAGLPLLVVDVAAAMNAADGWATAVALAFREARLNDAALLWRGCDALLEREAPPRLWEELLASAEAFDGLTLLAAETPWVPAGRFRDTPFIRVDLRTPSFSLRRRLWGAELPAQDEFGDAGLDRAALADLLANSFQFTRGQIRDSVATARGLALERDALAPVLTVEDLAEGARRQSSRRLITFTRRIEPRAEVRFDDLILPAANLRQLRELRERIANRGRVHADLGFDRRVSLAKGVIALFTGSSGTGKTMAAELLAREQGVDLYKVDLAAIVSKYVGETEKNLARVFAEAEDANAILLFDEADALFGKRGEVREARDRWANLEVSFLLQRVEDYSGVVVMASNLRQNIDEAFTRRIAVIVEFPFPDASTRLQILQGLFPAGITRPEDDELASLAERFRLSGGSARNIVVDAAFRAVAEDPEQPAITIRHLVVATAREYQKLGKPITRGDFGESFYTLLEEDVLAAGAAA